MSLERYSTAELLAELNARKAQERLVYQSWLKDNPEPAPLCSRCNDTGHYVSYCGDCDCYDCSHTQRLRGRALREEHQARWEHYRDQLRAIKPSDSLAPALGDHAIG